MKERGDEIIGKRVVVKKCEARMHGDSDGCVCPFIGMTITIEKKYDSPFVGIPSYHIKGSNRRVRRREVILPRRKK